MPSSVIRSFQYRPHQRALDVEFVSGRRYRYSGVPGTVANALGEAFSKGRYFNAHIRDHFPYVGLAPEPEDWSGEWNVGSARQS